MAATPGLTVGASVLSASPCPLPSPNSLSYCSPSLLHSPNSYYCFASQFFIYGPNGITPIIQERETTHDATGLWRQQPRFLRALPGSSPRCQLSLLRRCGFPPACPDPQMDAGAPGLRRRSIRHFARCSGTMCVFAPLPPASSKEGPLSIRVAHTPSPGPAQSSARRGGAGWMLCR